MEPTALVRRRAVDWCRNLAGWFPHLRPGPDALALAEDVAVSLGPNDGHVPEPHVRAVCELVSEAERRRLVESFASEHADQWAAICADSGEVEVLEEALVTGVVRVAIIERRLPPARRLSDLESGRAPTATSCDVLVVTLPPETVWSVVDVDDALRVASTVSSPHAWIRNLPALAAERVSDVHSRRVRTLAQTLRRQLPLTDYARATALLAEAYSRAVDDPRFAREVAEALLPVYATQRVSYTPSEN